MKSENHESPAEKPEILTEEDGIGKVLHYGISDTYEMRLEMGDFKASYSMNGKDWEEFIDFSDQDERKEFFILLKEKYPELYSVLKDDEMRMDFLKFIESTYNENLREDISE